MFQHRQGLDPALSVVAARDSVPAHHSRESRRRTTRGAISHIQLYHTFYIISFDIDFIV
jgi:hypothetical protein